MKVDLIAYTTLTGVPDSPVPDWKWQSTEATVDNPYGLNESDLDELAEFAGRACYESWSRPNPKTATNRGYLAHILEVDHGSVLEHASATFYVTGVSRSLLAELTRHRHLSFSVRSQRFVDESKAEYVIPLAIVNRLDELTKQPGFDAQALTSWVHAVMEQSTEAYTVFTNWLTKAGLTRKEVREAARAVLPQMTETRFVVTGNLRAWRYVIKRRIAPEADAEIRLLAQELLRQLKEIAPNTFQDM